MNGSTMALDGKSIYIAGPRRLDNEALARFLAGETGTHCEAVSFSRLEALGYGPNPQRNMLFLVDALDPGLRATSPRGGVRTNGNMPAALFSALFREGADGNGAGKPAPGCPCGFFYRFDSADRFLHALRDVFCGRMSLSGSSPVAFMSPGSACDPAEGHPLSPREFHILFLMAGGLHNRDIAAHLNISGHTVRTHLYNIFRKIHVRSRVQASLWIHGHVERFFCLV